MQKPIKDYIVHIHKLKLGKHDYNFSVGEAFFANFEDAFVQNGDLQVEIELNKQSEVLFVLNFHIHGTVQLNCDRCLDEFAYPLDTKERLLLKLEATDEKETDDDLVILDLETHQVDLFPFIYDFINLAVPFKRTCEMVEKECDPEMLKHLDNGGKNDDDDTDPRWDDLKNISLS